MSDYQIKINVDASDYKRLKEAGNGKVEEGVRRALRIGTPIAIQSKTGQHFRVQASDKADATNRQRT